MLTSGAVLITTPSFVEVLILAFHIIPPALLQVYYHFSSHYQAEL